MAHQAEYSSPMHQELQLGRMRRLSTWRCVGVAAASIAGLALLVAGGISSQRRARIPAMRAHTALFESKSASVAASTQSDPEDCEDCCSRLPDVSLPGNDIKRVGHVHSADSCCSLCRDDEQCLAWTWVESSDHPFSHVCFLKGALPRPLTRTASMGYVSGIVHQADKKGSPLQVHTQPPGQSLYCIALTQPTGYELSLISMQFDEGASLFNCDEYGVYSNKHMEVAPGVWASVVNSTLQCEMGGEFGTALNTGIFLAVWAKIIADGRFLYHDWTVKVDPDAVFLPSRLRSHLMNHLEDERGVYINNCKFGLHGPLEVFSRNAVKVWALGAADCVTYFTELCSGMCGWGEDMFIDQCLKRKLKVRRDNDFAMLLEDHCQPPKHWDDCTNTSAVAFHPFKTNDGWRTCYHHAHSIKATIFRK